jgi:hypothetical protein
MHAVGHVWQAAPAVPQASSAVPGRQARFPWQQPVEHEVASHTQTPATQRRPASHAAPAPHWQVPAAEQLSAVVGSQLTQVPPPVPQVPRPAVTQLPDAQQPLAHDWALHTQAPATHTVPGPLGGPLPQAQVPVVASQVSLAAAGQATQAPPPVPQVGTAGTRQAPPAQHPPAQEAALHTQAPATHAVPAPQAAPAPQRHSPVAAQLSARAGSHITHAAPPIPQDIIDNATQVDPEQHPPGQVVGLQSAQAPPAQIRPAQSWQAAPPLPQLVVLVPGWQAAPAQQPLAHEVRSQTHAPAAQR